MIKDLGFAVESFQAKNVLLRKRIRELKAERKELRAELAASKAEESPVSQDTWEAFSDNLARLAKMWLSPSECNCPICTQRRVTGGGE